LSQNLIFFKTHKNLYTGPLYVSDLELGLYNLEIECFSQFLPQTSVFCKTEGWPLLILSWNLKFFKTHKNLYAGWGGSLLYNVLCVDLWCLIFISFQSQLQIQWFQGQNSQNYFFFHYVHSYIMCLLHFIDSLLVCDSC
jgi:hypothetical protein